MKWIFRKRRMRRSIKRYNVEFGVAAEERIAKSELSLNQN